MDTPFFNKKRAPNIPKNMFRTPLHRIIVFTNLTIMEFANLHIMVCFLTSYYNNIPFVWQVKPLVSFSQFSLIYIQCSYSAGQAGAEGCFPPDSIPPGALSLVSTIPEMSGRRLVLMAAPVIRFLRRSRASK